MADLQECGICGQEKPAEMIDRTTVEPIAPMEADICRVCQHVQDHELPDDVCMKCGDETESGFYVEVEYPLGSDDLPAFRAGSLCGDCAGWIGCDIAYESLEADPEAYEKHIELLEKETAQRKELEGQP